MHGPATKTISLTRVNPLMDDDHVDIKVSRTAEHYNMRNVEAGFIPHIEYDIDGTDQWIKLWYAHEDNPDVFIVLRSIMLTGDAFYQQLSEHIDAFICQNPCAALIEQHEGTMNIAREEPFDDDDSPRNIMLQIDQVLGKMGIGTDHLDTEWRDKCEDAVDDIQELVNKWQAWDKANNG